MLETGKAWKAMSRDARFRGSSTLRLSLLLYLALIGSACSTSDMSSANITSTSDNSSTNTASTSSSENSQQTPFTTISQGEDNAQSSPASVEAEPEMTDSIAQGALLPVIEPNENTMSEESTDSADSQVFPEVSCSTEPTVFEQRALQLLNDARAVARNCGGEAFAAARPLRWNVTLATAAMVQSRDMATHNFFSHTGSDGSSAAMRVTSAGYTWQAVGENIAAGQTTAADTINSWLDSPGHCRNIMNQQFSEMAVSCMENSNSDFKRYWTNILATAR